jgi:uncharacterized RDD family membrane protein YckC
VTPEPGWPEERFLALDECELATLAALLAKAMAGTHGSLGRWPGQRFLIKRWVACTPVQGDHRRRSPLLAEDPAMTTAHANAPAVIAGFWRRAVALFLDALMLGLVGLGLGLVLRDEFVRLGSYGGVVGLVVAWPYFALMSSRLGGGQTLGKRALGIRVVSASGAGLSVGAGFYRAAIYCVPYFVSGLTIDDVASRPSAGTVLVCIILVVELCDIYLFVFNRRTRQSLHDLAVDSLVVKVGAEAALQPGRKLWLGHAAAMAVLVLLGAAMPWFVAGSIDREPLASLLPLQQQITKEPGVRTAAIQVGKNTVFKSGGSHSTTYLMTQVLVDSKGIDGEALADRIARTELRLYPAAADADTLSVSVVFGYNIGIASSWLTSNFSHSPADWRKRLDMVTLR